MNKKLTKVLTVPTLIAVILTATAFGFRPILHPPTAKQGNDHGVAILRTIRPLFT